MNLNMNKRIKAAIGSAIIIAISLSGGVIYKQLTKPTPEEMRQEVITEIVKVINKESQKHKYPLKIDEETQLDSFKATHRGIYYKYTLFYSGELPPSNSQQVKKQITSSICSDKTIRRVMQYGLPYIYEYYKPNGHKWFSVRITIKDCCQQ